MTDLAIKIGCSQASISQWEKGLSDPGPKYLIKLREVFGNKFDIIDNTNEENIVLQEPEAVYDVKKPTEVNKIISDLVESNKLIAESNKILSESNKVLSQSIQKAMDIHNSVMIQLLELEAVK